MKKLSDDLVRITISKFVGIDDNNVIWQAIELRDLVKLCRAIEAEVLAGVVDPQEHDYYGAGEPDCPREIKGANGELHTLQCRYCGERNPRSAFCRTAPAEPVSGQRALIAELRDWFESQAKTISKGCGSPFELMQVREMRDKCEVALTTPPASEAQTNDE